MLLIYIYGDCLGITFSGTYSIIFSCFSFYSLLLFSLFTFLIVSYLLIFAVFLSIEVVSLYSESSKLMLTSSNDLDLELSLDFLLWIVSSVPFWKSLISFDFAFTEFLTVRLFITDALLPWTYGLRLVIWCFDYFGFVLFFLTDELPLSPVNCLIILGFGVF